MYLMLTLLVVCVTVTVVSLFIERDDNKFFKED